MSSLLTSNNITTNLKQRVYTLIDKLSDRSTLSQATTELQHLIKSLDTNSLSSFLCYILSLDPSSSKPHVRVTCISLLTLLPPCSFHFLSPKLLLRHLRDPSSAVRAALVAAVSHLSPANLSAFLTPLLTSVLTENDASTQIGACMCLKAALDSSAAVGTAVSGGDEVELRRGVVRMVKMVKGDGFVKARAALLGVVGSVVRINNGNVVNFNINNNGNFNNNKNNNNNMVGNVVGCAVEMLSSEDWSARKAASEVLEMVAMVVERETAMEVKRVVVSALEARRFDKVKITRETMNRALETWKEVPGGPEDDLLLSRSNSSVSKDNGSFGSSPSISRRSSFAGWETPKPKKTITKTRSSLSDSPVASISSSISTNTRDAVGGVETPQRKKTLSKSRSSLSDDSTVTDSSSVSKSSHDIGSETPQSKKPTPKSRSSLPDDFAAFVAKKKNALRGNDARVSPSVDTESKKPLDCKLETALPPVPTAKVVLEEDVPSHCGTVEVTTSGSEMRSNFLKKNSQEKSAGLRSGYSRVVPFVEEDRASEVGENNGDVEDLSLIRNQLLQIEKQQSNLLDLLQSFMGNSQNGIDSLETRVSGLERALDEISYDLAVQSGRIPNKESAGSTCCPSTEFLSPKFWKRTEGRSSTSKSSYLGSMQNKDGYVEALQMDGHRLHEQNEGMCRDSWGNVEFNTPKSVRSIGQNTQRGRTCSPRSFDAPSTAPFMTPVVRGA